MARKTGGHFLRASLIPAAYSWPASALLATLAWYQLAPRTVLVAWAIVALGLFELGTFFLRSCLRAQAYTLFAVCFVRLAVNLQMDAGYNPSLHRSYTVVPLIAAYLWVYERTRRALSDSKFDRAAGIAATWAGTFAALGLLGFELRWQYVAIGWTALAVVLLYAAWLLKRSIFTGQALCVLGLATGDALVMHLFGETLPSTSFWTSRSFYVGAPCLLMLLALPAAFAMRRDGLAAGANPTPLEVVLAHSEQAFFFVPLALTTILLTVELRNGAITIGWIALGLFAFLFVLPIGERSYRLAGLGLLLLGLGKILLVDFWSASPKDRYVTLIVTGFALLLVSFLYSRYRETILKLL